MANKHLQNKRSGKHYYPIHPRDPSFSLLDELSYSEHKEENANIAVYASTT